MKTVFSEKHELHFPQGELFGGQLVTPHERPSRMEYILRRLAETGMPAPDGPDDVDMAAVRAVHDEAFLEFLRTAWDEWKAEGFDGEVIAASLPTRRQDKVRPPRNIDGKAGYYCMASETAITAGTWEAALSSAATAQSAQKLVAGGERAAFALCRPPGHHATRDQYGGFCFLNNAAIAAQMFIDGGAERVAVLDVDFHHGNGTQDIFYDRADVLFCSLHGDPLDAFPYFTGYADETGAGAGEGYNVNYPIPEGSLFSVWRDSLKDAVGRIGDFGADALVVSLGVDTFEEDPISFFKLKNDDYKIMGADIGELGLPTLFVMEGGYAIEDVGINTVNVLEGFEGA